jgi:acetyl esterase/lipase
MLDHLLGKPSSGIKRIQTILWICVALFYIKRGPSQGPAWFRNANRTLSKYSPWQIILSTLTSLYILKHGFLLLGMNAPEPFARIYSRDFYRATWIMRALDAGFWTAMNLRPKPIRDLFSIIFTLYYLVFADQAEQKVRNTNAAPTIEHMRVSWNKVADNSILWFIACCGMPRMKIRRRVEIPRSDPKLPPIEVLVLFDGTEEEFVKAERCIIHFHGGGFVAMNPQCHEEYLRKWAVQTNVPIFSVNYRKAPEYPYPYAIEECFEAYRLIVESNGARVGLSGQLSTPDGQRRQLQTVIVGDSAGGNLCATVMLRIIEYPQPIPYPNGLVIIYPVLDFNIRCWLEPEHVDMLRTESSTALPRILESRDHMSHKSPLSVRSDTVSRWRGHRSLSLQERVEARLEEDTSEVEVAHKNHAVWKMGAEAQDVKQDRGYRLMMTSFSAYLTDRILSMDLLRAMLIMYLGPNNHPDFARDYYLSPIVAPSHLLAKMPPVFIICGERDPLVDDSIRFIARLRRIKREEWKRKYGDRDDSPAFDEQRHVRIRIIDGMSHGFLQMSAILPGAKQIINLLGSWLEELLYHPLPGSGTSSSVRTSSISPEEYEQMERWSTGALVREDDLLVRRGRHLKELHPLPTTKIN